MKCLMCNGTFEKPTIINRLKYCPLCNQLIGTTLRFNSKRANTSQEPKNTDMPKEGHNCEDHVKREVSTGDLVMHYCSTCNKIQDGPYKGQTLLSSVPFACTCDITHKNPVSFDTDRPKDKKGKYQPHLVLGSLTRAIARVREYGVRKYKGEDGWKQQTAKDYMDAIGRHYDECRNYPESRDLESGLLHIAQIATNAMFVIQMLKEQGIDLDSMNNPPEVK